MIRLENVTFGYAEQPVLTNVSFQIPPGESRVIMGPSGSGKSTILRLLLGLDQVWSGRIFIGGEDISRLRTRQLQDLRKRIGMVFQDGALFDSMTIGENVGYYLLEHTNKSPEEIESEVLQMLSFVDLSPDIIDRLPEELSGGMRRRVAIARALLSTHPQIMLFDEPTTGLDPVATKHVLDLIIKLQAVAKVSVIIVTHQIADALKLADKFIVIQRGEKVFDSDLTALRESDDPRVTEFLAPFRVSIREVVESRLV